MSMPEVITRYSLREQVQAVELELQLGRLSATDDLWTAYLDGATPEDAQRESREVDQLAIRLIEDLRVAEATVGRLRSMLEASPEAEFDFALERIAERYTDIYLASRERLADLLDEYSIRGVAIEACAYLESQVPKEVALVEEKRERLRAGEFQTGDMSPPARCALSGAKLGVSALLIAMTGGGAIPVLLGGAMAFFDMAESWEGGCGTVAGGIWSRLRAG